MRNKFNKNQWATFVAVSGFVVLLTFGLVYSVFKNGIGSADAAAWMQAIGSIGAILVAVWVSYRQHEKEDQRDQSREAQEVENMLYSLRDEIDVLWEAFEKRIGQPLMQTQPGTPFMVTWPAPERPFVVYEGYKDKIGKIQDHSLRRMVIVTYARADGLLLSFRMNNALYREYKTTNDLAAQTEHPVHQHAAAQSLKVLTSYADGIRSSYAEVKESIEQLLASLPQNMKKRDNAMVKAS